MADDVLMLRLAYRSVVVRNTQYRGSQAASVAVHPHYDLQQCFATTQDRPQPTTHLNSKH